MSRKHLASQQQMRERILQSDALQFVIDVAEGKPMGIYNALGEVERLQVPDGDMRLRAAMALMKKVLPDQQSVDMDVSVTNYQSHVDAVAAARKRLTMRDDLLIEQADYQPVRAERDDVEDAVLVEDDRPEFEPEPDEGSLPGDYRGWKA